MAGKLTLASITTGAVIACLVGFAVAMAFSIVSGLLS
jgi:hypothetical protein